jgi:hypothetical protein
MAPPLAARADACYQCAPLSRLGPAFLLASAVLVVGASSAQAKPPKGGSPTGYDVSYPQCGAALPTNVSFAIVGVNDGIVYSANPCLGAADGSSELAWAERFETLPILYANTGDPGPALSSHWPTGQTTPQLCDATQPDSSACSYDYGWNAAIDSYHDAVNAYISLGQLAASAAQTPQPNEWWLDVESANSWESNTSNNVSELQGEVAYLQSQGVTTIGFYATASDWQTITANTTVFNNSPSWHPGAGSQRAAASFCGTTGITGGPTRYSQYASGGLDADVRCN